MSDFFVRLQNVLPQHGLSRLAGAFTRSHNPLIRRALIGAARRAFDISLADAARRSPDEYRSFDDFFTRELAPGARPLPADPHALASPADGTLSQLGTIERGALVQAKGHTYSARSLLGDAALARQFDGGWFGTIYLAPADYHRVHVPLDGTLIQSTEIPGELFSVNARTEAGLLGLFCRNERLVCLFETETGPLVVVMVGALIVASIDTPWGGPVSPYRQVLVRRHRLPMRRGDELGRFRMGSTAIVITPPGRFRPHAELASGQRVLMGQALGMVSNSPP